MPRHVGCQSSLSSSRHTASRANITASISSRGSGDGCESSQSDISRADSGSGNAPAMDDRNRRPLATLRKVLSRYAVIGSFGDSSGSSKPSLWKIRLRFSAWPTAHSFSHSKRATAFLRYQPALRLLRLPLMRCAAGQIGRSPHCYRAALPQQTGCT